MDVPDTRPTVPVQQQSLNASSGQLNGLMQLGTSESQPSHRALDDIPRCVTVLDRNLAESIISSYSACHGYVMPSLIPKLCVAGFFACSYRVSKVGVCNLFVLYLRTQGEACMPFETCMWIASTAFSWVSYQLLLRTETSSIQSPFPKHYLCKNSYLHIP